MKREETKANPSGVCVVNAHATAARAGDYDAGADLDEIVTMNLPSALQKASGDKM